MKIIFDENQLKTADISIYKSRFAFLVLKNTFEYPYLYFRNF